MLCRVHVSNNAQAVEMIREIGNRHGMVIRVYLPRPSSVKTILNEYGKNDIGKARCCVIVCGLFTSDVPLGVCAVSGGRDGSSGVANVQWARDWPKGQGVLRSPSALPSTTRQNFQPQRGAVIDVRPLLSQSCANTCNGLAAVQRYDAAQQPKVATPNAATILTYLHVSLQWM